MALCLVCVRASAKSKRMNESSSFWHGSFSGEYKLEGVVVSDQEGLHFYVGSNFHRHTSETLFRTEFEGVKILFWQL